MLVLSRRKNERINIGDDIQVVILEIQGNRVRLGLVAPPQVPILREELKARAEWVVPEGAVEVDVSGNLGAGGLKCP
jgi:carbon storage regulator